MTKVLKWWPVLAGTLALLVALGTAVWATAGERSGVHHRIEAMEVWKGEHVNVYGHPATTRTVLVQGEQLRALEKSVERLEAVAIRLEARARAD